MYNTPFQTIEDDTSQVVLHYLQIIEKLDRLSERSTNVDDEKELTHLRDVVLSRISNQLERAKGKVFVVDLARLPRTEGWTVDKWLDYLDNKGVLVIDTANEI